MNKIKISALVITYNEINCIKNCIDSIDFADEIIVVDSYSTDGTYEYLLNHHKVKVIQKPFENFTNQKSFTLKQATNDWVLFLDADEIIPAPLRDEILSTIDRDTEVVAYWFYRQFMFKEKVLRYSGWQTDKNYRFFKKSKVNFSDKKIVHETLEVKGKSDSLKEKMPHYSYKNYQDYKFKMINYGRLKAKEAFYVEKKFSYGLTLLRTSWKFFNHYILRLGILDGKKGVIICYLNALSVFESCIELKRLEKKNQLTSYLIMP